MHRFFKVSVLTVLALMVCGSVFAAYHAAPLQCNNCHTMHNFQGGVADTGGNPENYLLKKAGSCKGCHDGSMLAAGAPDLFSVTNKAGTANEAPAGSFYDIALGGNEGKGHNPIACGILTDTVLGKTPPGGVALVGKYTCGSCHNPHGGPSTTNSYKLLLKKPGEWAGADLTVTAASSSVVVAGAMVPQNATNHNGYQAGFPQWCAACHGSYSGAGNTGIHNTSAGPSPWLKHPTNQSLTVAVGTNYTANTDYQIPLMDAAYTGTTAEVARGTGRVFCMTCHKAHATVNNDACRWNNGAGQTYGATTANCQRCHNKGS